MSNLWCKPSIADTMLRHAQCSCKRMFCVPSRWVTTQHQSWQQRRVQMQLDAYTLIQRGTKQVAGSCCCNDEGKSSVKPQAGQHLCNTSLRLPASIAAGTTGRPTIQRQLSGTCIRATSARREHSIPPHSKSSYSSTSRPRTWATFTTVSMALFR